MAIRTIAALNSSLQKWAIQETQRMQKDLFTSIRNETPVDTGRARDGWQLDLVNKVGDQGHIENDVEYIGWLEFGSDTVAPQAMVRRNIKRVTK